MEIKINGQTLDITLDKEKTVGEVMAGLENSFSEYGHRLSGVLIDGEEAGVSSLEKIFAKEIDSIKTLDITTLSLPELTIMSFINLLEDIEDYKKLEFDERKIFLDNWKESPEALFAAEQSPDIFAAYKETFSANGLSPDALYSITEERLREVENPTDEFKNLKPLLDEVCTRLVDLPLDIQTGKDAQAAQTIQIFSGIAEKIFRITRQLDLQGYIEVPLELINGFSSSVKELLQAYESNDTVLIGDLAEYEMAPRIIELYDSILKGIQ